MTVRLNWRKLWRYLLVVIIYLAVGSQAQAEVIGDELWPVIHEAFFAGKTIEDGSQLIQITAPAVAEDAGLVPISVEIDTFYSDALQVAKAYLITDANPVQLTAIFHFPKNKQPIHFSTRVRLEKSTYVRVIVETGDGRYYMHKVGIKTPGGGCGGGIGSDEAQLRVEAGRMKIQLADPVRYGEVNTLSFNIKHPMRTGFERTVYGYYAKPYFIKRLDFMLDNAPLMSVDVGVGISANPYIRFDFIPSRPAEIEILARDNEDQEYQQGIRIP
ncbi:MAG: quinoprotein dehydrogenase-associated SoxYZ-like carrier [Betaproteobacteria bacterium HGW-Betaproteobacteria-1]|jgi:sulfur-oxidizing protein SoxY|nr:MAG: quinoprotein dehydrogenase-associated SoxYZ-like carrier [Betaproteobacteria bacterium HGW-Betaproteobacteria-1]